MLKQQSLDVTSGHLDNIDAWHEHVGDALHRNQRLVHQNDLAWILYAVLPRQQNGLKNDLGEREILKIRRAQPAAIQSGYCSLETINIAVACRQRKR